ncbi:MAG: hypothetical protein HUU15_05210 [Candidatus Brocadiae bacterium]|nr:hypothetical protein [Candidatus Brocadiia bacterium]
MNRVAAAVAVAGAALGVALAGWYVLGGGTGEEEIPAKSLAELRSGRDHLSLVISGRLLAEILPCGCRTPRKGGIERRATAIREMLKKDPATVVVDAGDSLVDTDAKRKSAIPELVRRKAEVMADFLKETAPAALALGDLDLLLGAGGAHDILRSRGLRPVLSNLRAPGTPDLAVTEAKWTTSGWTFLAVTLHAEKPDSVSGEMEWRDPMEALDGALREAGPVDIVVICAHGFDDALARKVIQRPGLKILVDADGRVRLRSTSRTATTLIVRPPDKGAEMRTVDLWLRRGATGWYPAERLERMELGYPVDDGTGRFSTPEEETAAANGAVIYGIGETALSGEFANDPALTESIRAYEAWVRGDLREILAKRAAAAPADAVYRGAEACGACHARELENWKTTYHAEAWRTLENEPGGATQDAECVSCHVSGFLLPGGPARIEDTGPFRGVQCESCHVPAGVHPGGPKFGRVRADGCTTCHSTTRDPRFDFKAYLPYATCRAPRKPGENRVPR